MKRILPTILKILGAETLLFIWDYWRTQQFGADQFFVVGILTLITALSFIFGYETRFNAALISAKPDGAKESFTIGMLESLFKVSLESTKNFRLGMAFFWVALLNLICYFVLMMI